jgi:predicted HTH transcriptional regulator
VGERYNASDADVVAVYDISNQANSQIRELSQNKQLTAQETRQRIEKIQAETQSDIVDLVGEDAAKSVLDNTRRYNFRRSGRGSR